MKRSMFDTLRTLWFNATQKITGKSKTLPTFWVLSGRDPKTNQRITIRVCWSLQEAMSLATEIDPHPGMWSDYEIKKLVRNRTVATWESTVDYRNKIVGWHNSNRR